MSAVLNLPRLLSEAEAAEYLGRSEITLRRMRKARLIGFIMVGKCPRYTEAHLREYLDANTCHATPSPTSSPSSSAKGPIAGISNGASAGRKSGVLQALRTLRKPESEPGS